MSIFFPCKSAGSRSTNGNFSFIELMLATSYFKPQNLLGECGFRCVNKGWISENENSSARPGMGLSVALKTHNQNALEGYRKWLAEVNYLRELRHPNLVKLIGYCIEDDKRVLVYEFMLRGSSENHQFKRCVSLQWSIRMKIMFGAVKDLAFLHEKAERPMIFGDFKTSNIPLDLEYIAKFSDFGLTKDAQEEDLTHVSTQVMGTYCYAALDYMMAAHKQKLYGNAWPIVYWYIISSHGGVCSFDECLFVLGWFYNFEPLPNFVNFAFAFAFGGFLILFPSLEVLLQEFKLATSNFKPQNLLGECGFGCDYKGWISENESSSARSRIELSIAMKEESRSTTNHNAREKPVASDVSPRNNNPRRARSSPKLKGIATSSSSLREELSAYSNLHNFSFNVLKVATSNFKPQILLGEDS
ncbi:serine/threonine-protein kinase CDG1-like [Gastrolobium bilobum]|uniref:serine/threonine-protein kinase CDG1-like n=1 Tax=Gastrolobium bilobum TaxID=150636 RepID=UPI002AAFCED6|nr:serine/threonine-protein kinase CDG1-like [Gastrolobium bilobum]